MRDWLVGQYTELLEKNKDNKLQQTTMEEPEEVTFQFLREITDGFSEKQKVGEGAFGVVYKGLTNNGKDIAIKILRDSNPHLDHMQFRNEFYNLTKVKHKNIVLVLGYCYEIEKKPIDYYGRTVLAEKMHRALCFEFVHNGSLQKHLSDESHGLDWHIRYKIIKGTCEGLKYIHKDLGESLLHLDLKPDNILLDENMVPKIADFGLSKIIGDKLTRTTQSPLGTLGYQPPEYIKRGEISEKFDIFSLGVIIIRIVLAPNDYYNYPGKYSDEFVDQLQNHWKEKLHETCSSGFLLEAYCRQVKTCTQIALDCLENDSQKRPDIVKIINRLNATETDINKNIESLQPPQRRWKTIFHVMTNHIKKKLRMEHSAITDQHEHSNFMISYRRSEINSDNTKETSLDVGKDLIIGREEKRKRLASLLESMSEKIIILPICGIGGIGKTTFARLIYSDTNFKHYSKVWVYVSSRFDLCQIGNSIISQLSGMENQMNEVQLIKSCLSRIFSNKKIIIVLDDLWENNTIQLVDLKDMLNPSDSTKTVVVVTTRSEDIAKKICSNIEPYKIEYLTNDMCWDIIRQKSGFEARHDKEKLVGIGKEIARKCGGVALAAQTLGSVLQSMNYDEWMIVKDSNIWNETVSKDASLANHVLASLKLSYFSMDDSLKLCFTYCAIFPKGHQIVKCDLIYQWLSLGFIKPTKMFSAYQLGENYIVHLLGLTFLQHSMSQTTYGTYGEHGTLFTMHDLVHDLAVSVLGDRVLDQSKQGNNRGSTCRYALLPDCSRPLESWTTFPDRLRALRFLDCQLIDVHGAAFEPGESLRVLDLSECLIQKLPDSIGLLKRLRYLNAPRIRERVLPESITKLSKLMYLSLHGSYSILELPESIGEMEGLVHLDLSGCLGIKTLPESFGNLTSLEHVDFANCKNVTGVSKCLTSFTKLQHLNLSNCKRIGDLPRAFGSLTELQYLNLSDSSYLSENKLTLAEFLGSLTKFKYLLGSLTKLKYLNLSSSNIYVNLSSGNQQRIISSPEALGSLTGLKYLNLSHHCFMGKLLPSFGNLCNLVHLDLSYCYPLRGLPGALNGLTKLQYLDLYKCSGFDATEWLQDPFVNLGELQHLNLGCCLGKISYHPDKINCLLGWICNLTNLEYLSLRENDTIYRIPKTLANLRKLHTLDLSSCGRLQRLPKSLSEMDSLKFLYTKECWKLDRFTLPQYIVADTCADESRNYHFQYEDGNPARLKISRLENVISTKEAQAINLVEKTDITQLALEWTRDANRFVDDAKVLTELQPPYSASGFRLHGYNSVSFPSWVMHFGAYLPDVTRIDMWDLPNCSNMPPLGQLPNLKWLEIRAMNSIKKIDVDLYGGPTAFPQLEEFRIIDMKCLEVWNTTNSMFPRLRNLEIRHCPRLSLCSAGASTARSSLNVECRVEPVQQWSLLRHLACLPYLFSPRQSLPESGHIAGCSDFICSSPDFLRGLTSLQTLSVENCESITWLPEGLGDLNCLTELLIFNCNGIKTLPERLGDLDSLKELHILNCKGIKTLPDSIQRLINLKRLVYYSMP